MHTCIKCWIKHETTLPSNCEFLAYMNSVHFTPQQSSCKNGNTNEQYNLPSCATCEIIRTNNIISYKDLHHNCCMYMSVWVIFQTYCDSQIDRLMDNQLVYPTLHLYTWGNNDKWLNYFLIINFVGEFSLTIVTLIIIFTYER